MGADASVSLDALVALLAPTLGEERARELARNALDSLGIADSFFSVHDAIRVLERLPQSPGIATSVSHFAQARLALRDTNTNSRRPALSKPTPPAPKSGSLTRADLAALLAPTLGQEKSDDMVNETLQKLGLSLDPISTADGLAVLEELAKSAGIVGIASRFAKAHLLMRPTKT
jgi:hypothetical protein